MGSQGEAKRKQAGNGGGEMMEKPRERPLCWAAGVSVSISQHGSFSTNTQVHASPITQPLGSTTKWADVSASS